MLRKYKAVVTLDEFYAPNATDARDSVVGSIDYKTFFSVQEVQITEIPQDPTEAQP